MQIKEIKKKILWFLGNNFTGVFVNLLCKTLFLKEENKNHLNDLIKNNNNFIFVFWHGTMLVPWYIMKNKGLSTIISKSNDGEILTRLLNKWKYNVKRGSSSKGGKQALDHLISDASNNKSIAITPDGPQGPAKVMKAGAAIVAKKTETPIILVGTAYKQRIKLNSWDKFEVPMFFTKACIKYSEPIYVNKNLSYEETDKLIKNLGVKLNNLQLEAEKCC